MPTECQQRGSNAIASNDLTQQLATHQEQHDQQQVQHQIPTTTTSLEQAQQDQQDQQQQQQFLDKMEEVSQLNGEMSSSQTSTTSSNSLNGSISNGSGRKSSLISPDPTPYVTKARVTRPTPPPPSYNPMQFVQIKPCNLYQTAQQQLKKAEEVKKIKEIQKEEPEEWQNNLDNWKSSRRKRVEHIIDRVVEVKKLELEEHDRTRRKSKTFSEMIEERGERGGARGLTKLASLAVYNEEESNDFSDLGIGTSSASGKSSLSEDYDNNSVTSDNAEVDKTAIYDSKQQQNSQTTREYVSSPGYDTSSSTAPASSPDPCEYTYEGAIQDYKQRVSRAVSTTVAATTSKLTSNSTNVKSSNDSYKNGHNNTETYPTRRGSKIEDRLSGFEVTSPSDTQENAENRKVDVPKIDITKRKEIFEQQQQQQQQQTQKQLTNGAPKVQLRDRFKFETSDNTNGKSNETQQQQAAKKEVKRLSGDITSIKERLQSLEQQKNALTNGTSGTTDSNTASSQKATVDIPVASLKDRLSSLKNAVSREEVRKPKVALIDARQLEIMKSEEEKLQKQQQIQKQEQQQQQQQQTQKEEPAQVKQETKVEPTLQQPLLTNSNNSTIVEAAVDRDDSGIHTADDIETEPEFAQSEKRVQQLNAAIAALELEEKQLELAASAVNKIEADFEYTGLNTRPTAAVPTRNIVAQQPAAKQQTAAQQPTAATPFNTVDFSEISEALDAVPPMPQSHPVDESNAETSHKIEIKDETVINDTEQIKQQEDQNNDVDNNKDSKQENEKQMTKNEIEFEFELKMNAINNEVNNAMQLNDNKIINKDIKQEEIKEAVNLKAKPTAEELAEEEREIFITNEPIYQNVHETETNDEIATTKNIPNNYEQLKSVNLQNENNNQLNNSNNNNNNNNVYFNNKLKQQEQQQTHEQATNEQPKSAFNSKDHHQQLSAVSSYQNSNNSFHQQSNNAADNEPYYQVPKSSEPYYDAPKHLRPIPVYENIEIFYTGIENSTLASTPATLPASNGQLEPPKEKPPPPPIESPPPFDDIDSSDSKTDHTWSSSENTYETIHSKSKQNGDQITVAPISPPIKRMNSTKRIKKEIRNKRSSFLGIEDSYDKDESYLELTVAPPPDMAQLLQEERRLEKQLYLKAGLCDSSDTGESRDSGVSENHSRQSSEHYTHLSDEHVNQLQDSPIKPTAELLYQNDAHMHIAAQTPLLQTVKGNSAESWTESATAAAAASKSLTEAQATANAKMLSIEEKIREQEEVLRVERELLQFSQEELKRHRENLLLRENMARRELQHGAKMLMSANRHSLQDLNELEVGLSNSAAAMLNLANGSYQPTFMQQQQQQQQQLQHQAQQQQHLHTNAILRPQHIYANIPNLQQQYYQQADIDYRKSMSDLNEFSKRLSLPQQAVHQQQQQQLQLQLQLQQQQHSQPPLPPIPPTKPMRAMHVATTNGHSHVHGHDDYTARQRNSMTALCTPIPYGGSLVKIATPQMQSTASAMRASSYQQQQQQQQQTQSTQNLTNGGGVHHGNMTRNTLHALSATPKPKYTDDWVQVQTRKTFENPKLANDPAWLSAYQQKRKSMPDAVGISVASGYTHGYNNHWMVQEAEQRRLIEQQKQQMQMSRRSIPNGKTMLPANLNNGSSSSSSNGKPLPDAIIQMLTERVQSKGLGERKRFDNSANNSSNNSPSHAATATAVYQQHQQLKQQQQQQPSISNQQRFATHAAFNSISSSNATSTATTTSTSTTSTQDKVLSVSGKKKCSHCGDELGRGAAMIIESLLLFYHINCFKCCVCHVQLGDGLNGTDVRVRNHKLHCQNCYSSDDGIKFSCV